MPLRICTKKSLGETACFERREDVVRIVLTLLGVSEHFQKRCVAAFRTARKILNLGKRRLTRSRPGRLDVEGLCRLQCWSKRKLQWTILMRNSRVRLAISICCSKAHIFTGRFQRNGARSRERAKLDASGECKKERVTIATDIIYLLVRS